jgi:hypothetical protein
VRRVTASLALLLGIAVGARTAWELLNPLLPSLVAGVLLLLLGAAVMQRRWR